eukprot:6469634-Amphidinium_carterae.1
MKLKQAEHLLMNGRELCKQMGLSEAKATQCLGLLDCRIACHLLKKGKEAEGKEFQTIDEIAAVLGLVVPILAE